MGRVVDAGVLQLIVFAPVREGDGCRASRRILQTGGSAIFFNKATRYISAVMISSGLTIGLAGMSGCDDGYDAPSPPQQPQQQPPAQQPPQGQLPQQSPPGEPQ